MLTQLEADTLIAMRKIFIDKKTISIQPGMDKSYNLVSEDKRERFILDLWRGTIKLSKASYNVRGHKVIVLARLDINGMHINPNGVRIEGTHLHLYREGYEDRWAFPVDTIFTNTNNLVQSLEDFCQYCKIENIPSIQETLLL